MSLVRLYIDGSPWEIMGNAVDSFLPFTNEVQASRGGRIYASTESRVRTVSIDDVMVDNDEFEAVAEFLGSCSGRRFNVTMEFQGDCEDPTGGVLSGLEYNYIGCLIQGEPEYSLTERKISGFEFAYEDRIKR